VTCSPEMSGISGLACSPTEETDDEARSSKEQIIGILKEHRVCTVERRHTGGPLFNRYDRYRYGQYFSL